MIYLEPTLSTQKVEMASIGVLQSLADHEPDVDAIFREVQSTPMIFEVRNKNIILMAKLIMQ